MLPSASSSSPTRKATIRRASGVPPSFLDRVVPVRQFHPAMKRAFAIVLGACCASAAAAPKAPLLVGPSPAWVTISTEELRGAFDTLWAVSDVHGRLRELDQLLLAANLVSRDAANQLVWNPSQRRQLLVVVGDYIDGGPESVGVVLRVRRLIPEAAAAGSRIVTLLGNHEAAFLADPRSANRRLLSSARRASAELALPSRLTPEQLADSEFGTFLRSMPIAAFIGSWLFAHSGYLDAQDDPSALQAYFAALATIWSRGGSERYRALVDPRSITSCHDWWKHRARRAGMRARLAKLGLNGLVFGHDPDALGARKVIAMNPDGWLIKLDTGLKTLESSGMLLKCDVGLLLRGAELAMSFEGKPSCQAMTPQGTLRDLSR